MLLILSAAQLTILFGNAGMSFCDGQGWVCFVFFGGFCVFGFVLVFFFSLKASEVYVSALMV